MKKGIKLAVGIVSTVAFCAWTTKEKNSISKAEWLIGTWENKNPKGSTYETWSRSTEKEFSGKSYMLKEKDTIVFENIRLVQQQDQLLYIPNMKGQNGGSPVPFTVKMMSETKMVFENPRHDFPQTISYTKVTSDSLIAEISGVKNGKERSQQFPMKRLK